MNASATAPIPAHRPPHFRRRDCRRHCRCCRQSARHGASHQCPRSRRRGRPLTRRGGSPPPGSPASISRSPVQRESGFRPAGAGLGFHTPRIFDAGMPSGALSRPCGVIRGQQGPCGCWSERVSRATRGSWPPWPCMAAPVPRHHLPSFGSCYVSFGRHPREFRRACLREVRTGASLARAKARLHRPGGAIPGTRGPRR